MRRSFEWLPPSSASPFPPPPPPYVEPPRREYDDEEVEWGGGLEELEFMMLVIMPSMATPRGRPLREKEMHPPALSRSSVTLMVSPSLYTVSP